MPRKGCDRHLAVLEQVSHFEFEVIVASHQSVNLCQVKNVVGNLLLLHEEGWSLIKGHQTPPASNFSLSKDLISVFILKVKFSWPLTKVSLGRHFRRQVIL